MADSSSGTEGTREEAPPAVETEEWVFTIATSSGVITKIERLEKPSGDRRELSREEYETIAGLMNPDADHYAQHGFGPANRNEADS